ncbi:hypothetical protein [Parafilimonas sp.]|uniref:hypothetical protein n=1 Tax=Parafilimonas sp. TaxID=1969739 RepID=UPI0039E4C6EB
MSLIDQPEIKAKQKKYYHFASFSLLVMLVNVVVDFCKGRIISGLLDLIFALVLMVVVYFIRAGKTKYVIGTIVISSNTFIILLVYSEGLDSGGFFYLLPLLFSIPFLLSNRKNMLKESVLYLTLTVASFCACILFCEHNSSWQIIPPSQRPVQFAFNSITATILCSVFAYIGIYFERKTKEELINAKRQAEKHEQKVVEQNKRLKDIAYLNAHVIRAPLANILALTHLIDETKIPDEEMMELIHYLQESAEMLDNNIRDIISKATYIND